MLNTCTKYRVYYKDKHGTHEFHKRTAQNVKYLYKYRAYYNKCGTHEFRICKKKREKKGSCKCLHKKASYKYKYKVYIKMPLCSNEQNVSWFTNKKLN